MAEDADGASVALVGDVTADEAAPRWVQYTDESGASYYANVATGEASWTLPEHEQVLLLHDQGNEHHDLEAHSQDENLTPERLATEVQQQVEEARRRHGGDRNVALASHWVEMYDPTRDALYYYALTSGEISWVRPVGDTVLRFDQDPITNTIVRIQCAIRVQLARRRVFNRKQSVANNTTSTGHTGYEHQEAGVASLVWVEVYDPVQQLLYYHCSATGETRWDPPTVFVTANESKEVAAAVSIQSLARGRQARSQMERKRIEKFEREQLRQRQREYIARPEAEREAECRRELLDQETDQIQHGDRFWGVDVRDREVRRQLAEEAMLASAELFWQRVNAARRQQRGRSLDWRSIKLEEESRKEREKQAELAESDTMENEEQQQVQYGDGFWGIQADERREAMARRAMEKEERTSRFFSDELNDADLCALWADEASTNAERLEKRRVMQAKRNQTKYMRWFYQQCSSVDDLLDYLWPTQQRFTPLTVAPAPPLSMNSTSRAADACAVNSPGRRTEKKDKVNRSFYKLDDLVVRERMERGDLMFGHRPILTIHHSNAAQIEARRGRFEIDSVPTNDVFDQAALDAKKPINTSSYRPPPPRNYLVKAKDQREEEVEDATKEPAIRYRRSQTPDPHIPARFNGVPFMSSQISPTRDILCGDHRKLTQLPSLAVADQASRPKLTNKSKQSSSPPHGRSSPVTTAAKKKTKANNQESPVRQRYISIFDHDQETVDPMATSYGFLSPFAAERRRFSQQQRQKQQQLERQQRDVEVEDDDEGDSNAKSPRMAAITRQFEQKERAILAQVFNWMDVDGSGTVNRKEMAWALAHDHEVLALAKQSALLRLLLKQRSQLNELFAQLDAAASTSPANGKKQARKSNANTAELSWDLFVVFCREMYARLTDQGLLPSLEPVSDPAKATASLETSPPRVKPADSTGDHEEEEELTIRRVFQLLDADGNGLLERREICAALYESVTSDESRGGDQHANPELSILISASRALQPLMHESLFMKAFTSFESADPDGICEEEFVAFCLEIAEIAAANHLS